VASQRAVAGPNFEWLLIFLGLAVFVGYFFRFRLGGWGNIEFAIVLAAGALYYFVNRRGVEWAAGCITVLVTGAIILCFFTPALVAHLPTNLAHYFPSPRALYRDSSLIAGIPVAFGLGWYLLNCTSFDEEKRLTTPPDGDPNIERLGLYLGLLTGLGLSIRNGLKGWFNIYCEKKDQYWTQFFWQHFHARGDEHYWDRLLWRCASPIYVACLVAIACAILCRPRPRDSRSNPFPHAYGWMWLVLIVQNAIAQMITGPLDQWNEVAFSIYYAILFALTAVIVIHYQSLKTAQAWQASFAGESPRDRPWGEV
jgi:hypothetical protein